jgi:hypothetical protein
MALIAFQLLVLKSMHSLLFFFFQIYHLVVIVKINKKTNICASKPVLSALCSNGTLIAKRVISVNNGIFQQN